MKTAWVFLGGVVAGIAAMVWLEKFRDRAYLSDDIDNEDTDNGDDRLATTNDGESPEPAAV